MTKYLTLIRNFQRLHEQQRFTLTQYAVYMELLNLCNSLRWPESFSLPTNYLKESLGVSRQTFAKIRQALRRRGLLLYSKNSQTGRILYSLPDSETATSQPSNVESNPLELKEVEIREQEAEDTGSRRQLCHDLDTALDIAHTPTLDATLASYIDKDIDKIKEKPPKGGKKKKRPPPFCVIFLNIFHWLFAELSLYLRVDNNFFRHGN